MNNLSAGKDIDSYCTKCRLELGHLIVAMVGDKVAKVKCNTCNGVHNYREVKKIQKPRGPATITKTQKNKGKTRDVSWEYLISKARGIEIPYGMSKPFKVGDLITHEVFGKGVVLLTSPKKCTAVFQDKERMLVSSN